MSDGAHQQDLATQIKEYHQIGEFDKALEISVRAPESNPADLEAYGSRWNLVADMFSEEEARKRIQPEIESFLRTQPENPDVLETAYWGYRELPGDTDNIPQELLDKMLRYPETKIYQAALFRLADRSPDSRQKWHVYQRFIDECTASDVPGLGWYLLAHQHLLWLAEDDRSLAGNDQLDVLLDRYLEAHRVFCQDTQQWLGWAFTEAVKWRLKFNVRLDKALDILERAEVRLREKEEQQWLVEHNKSSVEEAQKEISSLRGEVYFRQERWRESYDGLAANPPGFSESLWRRLHETMFKESITHYFWMLGRSAEGIGEWEEAKRYYAQAFFAPTPHAGSRDGLERVYHQIQRGSTETYNAFLKNAEAEYLTREDPEMDKIREKIVKGRHNRKAADFSLETLEGEEFTLSQARGKVLLLDVGASWCAPCNEVIPQIKTIYDRFSNVDEVEIWGINDGETPVQVETFLGEHQPPWPILLDRQQEVRKAYQIGGIPFFILIDKEGNWQYNFVGWHLVRGQPLIWMVEALLED